MNVRGRGTEGESSRRCGRRFISEVYFGNLFSEDKLIWGGGGVLSQGCGTVVRSRYGGLRLAWGEKRDWRRGDFRREVRRGEGLRVRASELEDSSKLRVSE